MTDEAKKKYEEGQRIHSDENHEGDYATCEEWVCISYRARARQVEARALRGESE